MVWYAEAMVSVLTTTDQFLANASLDSLGKHANLRARVKNKIAVHMGNVR